MLVIDTDYETVGINCYDMERLAAANVNYCHHTQANSRDYCFLGQFSKKKTSQYRCRLSYLLLSNQEYKSVKEIWHRYVAPNHLIMTQEISKQILHIYIKLHICRLKDRKRQNNAYIHICPLNFDNWLYISNLLLHKMLTKIFSKKLWFSLDFRLHSIFSANIPWTVASSQIVLLAQLHCTH